MVDFQKRDTKRGFPSLGDDDEESPTRATDGEAEIDEVRQELEERPEPEDDQDGKAEDEAPPADGDEALDSDDASDGDDAPDDGAAGGDAADGDAADGDDASDGDGATDDEVDADRGAADPDHDHHAHDVATLGAAVVTVTSSRTMDDDPSGDYLVSSLVDAGHDVVTRELIADDYDGIQHTVDTLVRRSDVDVVVTTGGTGVTPDDETIEAVRPLFEKELPGFGEVFRALSFDEVGTRAVATRATAGVADGVPVFCLPGSEDAVALGVERIVVEVAPHVAGLAGRDRERGRDLEHHHEHDHEHAPEGVEE